MHTLDATIALLLYRTLTHAHTHTHTHTHTHSLSPPLSLSLTPLPPPPPPPPSPSSGCYLGIYSGLGLSQSILVLLGAFTLAIAGIFASRTLHSKILKNILRSPMSFFDTTPLGRILNRFSKDVYIIDEVVPRSVRSFLFTFFAVLNSLLVIVVTTPVFITAIIPLGILYLLVQVRLTTCLPLCMTLPGQQLKEKLPLPFS